MKEKPESKQGRKRGGEHYPSRDNPRLSQAAEDCEARVRCIMKMMRECRWKTGISNHELAEEWGMSVFSVDKNAAEAGRRYTTASEEFDAHMAATFLSKLEFITEECLANGERKGAIDALRLTAQVRGLVGGKAERRCDDVTAMSDDELAREVAE